MASYTLFGPECKKDANLVWPRGAYLAVPRKQLNQDFSTNGLLKNNLAIGLMLVNNGS